MTGREAPVLGGRAALAVLAIVCAVAYVMQSLPWPADGVLAGAVALAYAYDLEHGRDHRP
jgi:hypothetical protein